MDPDHANRDRALMKIAELWRPLPWWERVVYMLAALLFLLAFFVSELDNHLPAGWRGEVPMTLNTILPDIDLLLLIASIPVVVAACVLVMRRRSPEQWHEFQRLWSVRMVFVGASVIYAFFIWAAWDTVIELATPPDRIAPHYLPSFLAVPFWAAGGLCLVGMVLAIPEVIVRASRAKRRQP